MTTLAGSRRARRVLGLLLLVNAVVVVLYAGLFAIHTFVVGLPRELTHMVNMNRESTLATWFGAALLTTAAVLSILSAALTPDAKARRGWIVLALGVTYLAVDEVVLIHERLPMLFRLDGEFATHAWLIPAIPIVLIALVVMAHLLRHLPTYMRPVLLTGLAVFTAGAIVIEGLTGFIGDDMGGPWWDKVFFPASVALEESLEFIGVIIVVAGIVAHLDRVGVFTRPTPGVRTPTEPESPIYGNAPMRASGPTMID
ncbi:MAG TPA: hypothetical protein VJN29_09140 [Intrasporangium sp.]|uniref:hypothetical protein n=1 Tax=Intrasporangium sp. TaxID=1925024 RepID=UPI002B47EFDB|nr:hypothetical protein [Intrasporangium sp.]HKX67374.1 hypothetical protein [Intrasporangium sp.]